MGMNGQRPDVSDEQIGMRTFQLRKAQAVEHATERMRQGLGTEWARFTDAEIEALGFVMGELWAYIAHSEWNGLYFSKLGVTDTRKILNLSRELVHHSRNSVEVLQDVHAVIIAKS